MRTVVDTPRRCRGPAHADQGTGFDRLDQETLAIGTGLTTVKERSPGFAELAPLFSSQPSTVSTTWATALESRSERAQASLRVPSSDTEGW
jgi:hypothetical protein